VLELVGRPTLYLLPSATSPWPVSAEAALREWGYDRDASGTPTFKTQLGPMVVVDRIEPLGDRTGLGRTLVATGRSMNHDPHFLLAAGSVIVEDADGVYAVDDRRYYLQ